MQSMPLAPRELEVHGRGSNSGPARHLHRQIAVVIIVRSGGVAAGAPRSRPEVLSNHAWLPARARRVIGIYIYFIRLHTPSCYELTITCPDAGDLPVLKMKYLWISRDQTLLLIYLPPVNDRYAVSSYRYIGTAPTYAAHIPSIYGCQEGCPRECVPKEVVPVANISLVPPFICSSGSFGSYLRSIWLSCVRTYICR